MNAFELEKQREIAVLDEALGALQEKVEEAMNIEGADKTDVFAAGVERYTELKFNKVMLEEGFDTELEEHMVVPLAVLNWFITKEGEAIAGLYFKYTMKVLSMSELTAEIEKHVSKIIDARLGMLRLGKLDA